MPNLPSERIAGLWTPGRDWVRGSCTSTGWPLPAADDRAGCDTWLRPRPEQLAFDQPGPGLSRVPAASAGPGRALPERYRVTDAAKLLRITPGALRRRAANGAIVLERSEYGEYFVTRVELARHVAEYRPRSGGRPPAVSDESSAASRPCGATDELRAVAALLRILEDVPTSMEPAASGHRACGRSWCALPLAAERVSTSLKVPRYTRCS